MAQAPKTSESVLERRRAAINRTSGVLTRLAPGRSLVDELIAGRRADANVAAKVKLIRE